MEGLDVKLVIAIIQDRDTDVALEQLAKNNIRVTRIATSGGFIRDGNTTLLMGVEDNEVQRVKDVLGKASHRRKMYMPMAVGVSDASYGMSSQIEVEVGGATIFVVDVDHFEQV
jgi:uncharacterized protein YaaQ